MPTLLGNYIAEELERQGKTQAWLAEQTGLSTSAISAIVLGKTELPEPATIRALAKGLGVEGARLTLLLGYPIDMGGNVARYAEIGLQLDSNPKLLEHLGDLLLLPKEEFDYLIRYLDLRPRPRRRSRRPKNQSS